MNGGINTYEYALNNPIRIYDPFGLEPNKGCVAACTVGGGIIGGGLGYLGGGLLGGAGGTLALPGGGTIGGAIGGAQLGGAAGATAGSAAGNAAGQALCPDDDEPKCKLKIQRVGGKWPGIPPGKVQCTYECKTDFGITLVTRLLDGSSCPKSFKDWVPGDHGY